MINCFNLVIYENNDDHIEDDILPMAEFKISLKTNSFKDILEFIKKK